MMKKIAIVHPFLSARSGSGSIYNCLKLIEVLKGYYELHLITGAPDVDFKKLNKQWGTHIQEGEIHVEKVPLLLLRHTPHFLGLRHSLVGRYAQKNARDYDLMLSAYNPYDFGVRGIQFIGDFLFSKELRSLFHAIPADRESSWFYRESWWRRLYLQLCRKMYPISNEGIWKNLTISNSRWTQDLIRKTFSVESVIIYPPVPDIESHVPWIKKENGFVSTGNLVPFKQIERNIKIIQAVRKKGIDVHLHLVGRILDRVYANKIMNLCRKYANWCFYEGPLYGQRKISLIDSHKFGIHGAQFEGFGIAIAEMVKAGCIVWVAEGGGQTEIVNHNALTYSSFEEAIIKICRVFNSREMQYKLRNHLEKQSTKFTSDRFVSEVRSVVSKLIKEQYSGTPH